MNRNLFQSATLFATFTIIACLAISSHAQPKQTNMKSDNIAAGWDGLPQLLSHIKAPTFRQQEFLVTDYGAVEGGREKCTVAFAKAIAACHKAGGGTVVVPAGAWLTGPIHFKDNVCFEVKKDATLHFSTDFDGYLPAVFVRWEGIEAYSHSPLFYANGCKNIGLIGEGTINGNGPAWWKWREQKPSPYRASNRVHITWGTENRPVKERVQDAEDFHWCPTFVGFYHCKNVLIEGLQVIDGPFWNIHPVYCTNVTVRGLTIANRGPNGDGCNPDSCNYVLIEDCEFDTGDDCIAIKSGKDTDGRRVGIPSQNIVVRNCRMKEGHGGVVCGSEMSGGVRNVYAEDCVMNSPELSRALRIKTNKSRGGYVDNINMRNVTVGEVDKAVLWINFFYSGNDGGDFIPWVNNVTMENVTSEKSRHGIMIRALEESPVTGLVVKNCTFNNVKDGNLIENVKDPQFINVVTNEAKKKAKKNKRKKKE